MFSVSNEIKVLAGFGKQQAACLKRISNYSQVRDAVSQIQSKPLSERYSAKR